MVALVRAERVQLVHFQELEPVLKYAAICGFDSATDVLLRHVCMILNMSGNGVHDQPQWLHMATLILALLQHSQCSQRKRDNTKNKTDKETVLRQEHHNATIATTTITTTRS